MAAVRISVLLDVLAQITLSLDTGVQCWFLKGILGSPHGEHNRNNNKTHDIYFLNTLREYLVQCSKDNIIISCEQLNNYSESNSWNSISLF